MTRYLVTGRSPDYRVSPWTNVPLTTGVGDELDLTLSAQDEAALTGAGVLERLDPVVIDSDTTITLPAPGIYQVAGSATITSVTAGDSGDVATLLFDDILTFTDGSNLKLAGDMTTSADDTITIICDGTNWYEQARSAN